MAMEQVKPPGETGEPAASPDGTPKQAGSDEQTLRSRRWWGVGVWGAVGLTIAIPEISAAVGGGWPTISNTVGHLESLHSWVRIIVLALIAAAVAHFARYSPYFEGAYDQRKSKISGKSWQWGRTPNGRLVRIKDVSKDLQAENEREKSRRRTIWSFAIAVVLVAAASLATFELSSSKYLPVYVMYGLIALVFLLIPHGLAWLRGQEVPFPTAARTIDLLGKWRHPVELTVCAGLAVLVVHLVAYPWP